MITDSGAQIPGEFYTLVPGISISSNSKSTFDFEEVESINSISAFAYAGEVAYL
jgi:hypothetical protein